MDDIIITVDPGKDKCGIAVVCRKGEILHKDIVPTVLLVSTVDKLAQQHRVNIVAIGDRTSSSRAKASLEQLAANGGRLKMVMVDEHRSTDEARSRYWQNNPPKGLRKLIPTTMQTPPVPVDDYVAIILAERYFASIAKG